ncbi:hypothetical protein KC316_g6365 [Hortaea werneckii]|nr:hypothetical protein KC324_g6231 [Hortaea werneckii]KAI7585039.1 hypothetical protein KC316_g6365 [Hortaea werneckii]
MDDNGHDDGVSYSDWQEQLPSHPAFSSAVGKLAQEAVNIVLRLLKILQERTVDRKALQNTFESAANAIKQCAGLKKIVAFLGDAGVGKSSTINSLTGIPRLAVAVSAGESVIKVTTIFTHELPSQSNNFAAEIRFSDEVTRKSLLREQLKNYFRYEFEFDDEWDDCQQKEYENACQTAFKIFRSLFCDKSDFESPRAGREFLENAYNGNAHAALGVMEEWCRTLLAEMMTGNEAILHFEADNVDDLNAQLSPYTTEHHDFEVPVLCHLINRVTIGARESRILQYITLADLPGTSDVNQVRAALAHEFRQQCDAVLVFEPIARCVDHPSAERNIATNAERFSTNMALVVTRSDDNVDDALAQNMHKKGQSIGDYFLIGSQIKQLDTQLMQIKRKIEKRRGAKRQKTTGGNFADLTLEELRLQRSELIEERQQQKNEQFKLLVDARNTHTTRLLQQDKRRFMPPDVCLTVHCVSNTHYIAHLLDTEPDGTLLDVEATGTPALRAWLLGIAAPSLLLAIEERIGKFSLLSMVLLCGLNPPRRSARLEFWNLQIKFSATVEAALGYHNKLQSTWHPSTLRAFFLKRGKHSTKLQPLPTCWNEKFVEFQTKEVLNPNWATMKERVHEELEAMIVILIDELHDVPKKLDKAEFMMAAQMDNISGVITQHVGRIRRAQTLHLETFDKELGNIKQNASFDEPGAYFGQAMRLMYEECSNMRVSHLQSDVTEVLRQHVQRFEAALEVENETPQEQTARQTIMPTLATALADMERIDKDLKALKEASNV